MTAEAGGNPKSDGGEHPSLARNLGPLQVQLISLGGIIGSSYFLGLGYTVAQVGPAIVAAFLFGGAIVWLVAIAMCDLCVEMPREGAFVSFAKELVGNPWAAGVGWSYWLNWCAYIASEMIAAGIIMHFWVPAVPAFTWSLGFAFVITAINLLNVRSFGNIESALALIKIAAVVVFVGLGCMIWAGLLPAHTAPGTTYLTNGQGLSGFMPKGILPVLLSMVVVLVNFQGTELIALSAAETKDPKVNIARATRKVAVRIIAIFVVPLLVLVAIFPSQDASIEQSVFAAALTRHGFAQIGALFSLVVLSAAFSCSNSGLYGTVRALYGLGKEGLAPRWLTRLNRFAVPGRATWVTIVTSWAFLLLFVFFERTSFYTWLLSVSGFTGAICWISISWCHVRFLRGRRRLGQSGRSSSFPGFPFLGYVSIVAQVACLVLTAFNPELRGCLYIGIPSVLIPMLIVFLRDRRLRLSVGAAEPGLAASPLNR